MWSGGFWQKLAADRRKLRSQTLAAMSLSNAVVTDPTCQLASVNVAKPDAIHLEFEGCKFCETVTIHSACSIFTTRQTRLLQDSTSSCYYCCCGSVLEADHFKSLVDCMAVGLHGGSML